MAKKDESYEQQAPAQLATEAPRIEEPPPPIAKKDQEKFDALVKEKRMVGLPRDDAETVARRQIAEDNRKK